MDQLQLPFAQRLVEEVHLAGHVGAGIVVGDDEFPKDAPFFCESGLLRWKDKMYQS